MAERRMFHKSILKGSGFLSLSRAAILLYIYLCLDADDDGFTDNVTAVCRMCRCGRKQLQELVDAGWLFALEGGVVAITHWHIHNQLRKDRYHKTIHASMADKLRLRPDKVYEIAPPGCQNGNQLATEERLGEDRSDEARSDQDRSGQDKSEEIAPQAPGALTSGPPEAADMPDYEKVLKHYHLLCPQLEPCEALSVRLRSQVDLCYREGYTANRLMGPFMRANESEFLQGRNKKNWRAGLAWLLEPEHLRNLEAGKYDNWQ